MFALMFERCLLITRPFEKFRFSLRHYQMKNINPYFNPYPHDILSQLMPSFLYKAISGLSLMQISGPSMHWAVHGKITTTGTVKLPLKVAKTRT